MHRFTPQPAACARSSKRPEEEALSWATQLEGWALVREKVLAHLDVRAARAARALAGEMRSVFAHIRHARIAEDEARARSLGEDLAALRQRAMDLVRSQPVVPARGRDAPAAPQLEPDTRQPVVTRPQKVVALGRIDPLRIRSIGPQPKKS
jgi:hypothetical protein